MNRLRVGYAMCGSFCTLKEAVRQMENLSQSVDITPIMSNIVYSTDTRFGKSEDFIKKVEEITGNKVLHTIKEVEPIGPQSLLDALIIAPCTGNTLAKLALGVTDTSVTMSAKAHLRNGRPLILAIATNDALSASAKNIGALLNTKNVYFVPMAEDDPDKKPTSVIADFSLINQTLLYALDGKQIQPIYKS